MQAGLRRSDVQLHHLGSGHAACVGDVGGDGAPADLQIGVGKGRVAEPVAKGEPHRNPRLVIVAVAHVDAFFIMGGFPAEGFPAGHV